MCQDIESNKDRECVRCGICCGSNPGWRKPMDVDIVIYPDDMEQWLSAKRDDIIREFEGLRRWWENRTDETQFLTEWRKPKRSKGIFKCPFLEERGWTEENPVPCKCKIYNPRPRSCKVYGTLPQEEELGCIGARLREARKESVNNKVPTESPAEVAI